MARKYPKPSHSDVYTCHHTNWILPPPVQLNEVSIHNCNKFIILVIQVKSCTVTKVSNKDREHFRCSHSSPPIQCCDRVKRTHNSYG
ncbi:hypothetical protein XELAEV_18036217mg [Xenopus laevis]|uniref:Uncharacterized protein n=1 Tax=Xenopus laevis TaxID=8355 RepID=A0A974CH74_XENLA|nr:hypothetical protein XELAEV_18036217mg [Xenopus laevis]